MAATLPSKQGVIMASTHTDQFGTMRRLLTNVHYHSLVHNYQGDIVDVLVHIITSRQPVADLELLRKELRELAGLINEVREKVDQ